MATRKRRASGNGHANGSAPTAAPSGNGYTLTKEREQRELDCVLTDAEFKARSDAMADAELAIEKLKETRKGVNGQIADAASERARLAHVIERKIEARMVECAWHDDYKQNVKRLIRQDTGAEVDTRPMTGADRQVALELPPVDGDGGADVIQLTPAKRKRGRPRKVPLPAATESTTHAH